MMPAGPEVVSAGPQPMAPPIATGAPVAPPAAVVGGPPPVMPVPSTPASPAGPIAPPPMTPAPAGSPPPAQVSPDGTLKPQPKPETIKNPFTRTAAMIVQAAHDQAERLSANLGEQASNTEPADNATVHEMMHFSPYGTEAPRTFWQKHDEYLQMAMANGDPDPYAVAERTALDEVYPYRAKIALLDNLSPTQKVQRAEQLLAISNRQVAAGNPHDALPHVTGPAGLPKGHNDELPAGLPKPKGTGGY